MTLAVLFSAASLLLCGFFFIYIRRRTGAERLLAEFREEVDKLIAEIDAVTDRDARLVEDRVKTLRALLEDADRRITLYARELNRRRSEESAYAALGRKAGHAKSSAGNSAAAGPEGTGGKTAGDAEAPVDLTSALAAYSAAEAGPVQPKPPGGPETPDKAAQELPLFVRTEREIEPAPLPFAEQAAELSKSGLSPDLIAARLGSTVAEVKMAIALSRRR
ncbi:MAG: hypothetical protein LBQ14_08365 [Treponema sp.]|jgi:hypothetical protein|nr:hypothetical protein [Treponema sp.]